MPDSLVAATLIRWLDDTALAGVIGSLSFVAFVLPPPAAGAALTATALRRMRRILGVALALLVVASAAELVARAAAMAGGGIGTAVDALPLVLRRTHFGAVWATRLAALALLVLRCARTERIGDPLALFLALVVAATTALTGHAADRGDLRPIALNDWLHVTAAAAWTGGLLCLMSLPWREPRAPSDPAALDAVAARFSRLAGLCVAAVVATGVANAWLQLSGVAALWQTAYGRVLGAKLAVVCGLVALGAASRFVALPRLASAGGASAAAGRRFARYVAGEVALAVLVYGCTALLGQLPPPRHDPGAHRTEPAHATAPRTPRQD